MIIFRIKRMLTKQKEVEFSVKGKQKTQRDHVKNRDS